MTRELVSYKWKAYAMPVFLINLAIYLVFLAFLTAFAVVLPLPTDTECDNRNRNDCIDGQYLFMHANKTRVNYAYKHVANIFTLQLKENYNCVAICIVHQQL